jgi:hypothetical protein
MSAGWRIQTTKTLILIVSWLSDKRVPVDNDANFTITIYAPVIYKAPCIMFWMRAYTLRGEVGGGWALEFPSFLGPVKWERAYRRVPFGAQIAPHPTIERLSETSPSPPIPELIRNKAENVSYIILYAPPVHKIFNSTHEPAMWSTYNSDFVKEEEGPFKDDIPTNSVSGIWIPVTVHQVPLSLTREIARRDN